MPDTSQDPAAGPLTYLDDWTARLAQAIGNPTISSATVTGAFLAPATGTVTITAVTHTTTGVLFDLDVSSVSTTPSTVQTTTTATLSNGNVDVAHHTIQLTDT